VASHHAEDGCDDGPAPLHPGVWPVADHVLDGVVEVIHSYSKTNNDGTMFQQTRHEIAEVRSIPALSLCFVFLLQNDLRVDLLSPASALKRQFIATGSRIPLECKQPRLHPPSVFIGVNCVFNGMRRGRVQR